MIKQTWEAKSKKQKLKKDKSGFETTHKIMLMKIVLYFSGVIFLLNTLHTTCFMFIFFHSMKSCFPTQEDKQMPWYLIINLKYSWSDKLDTRVFRSAVFKNFVIIWIKIKNYLTTFTENEPFGISCPPNFILIS